MNPSPINLPSLVLFSAVGFLSPWAVVAVDFRDEIRPILNNKCFRCHTGPRAKGGLRMDPVEDFSKRIGGDSPVIIPGNPDNSLLAIKAGLPRTDGDAMPPPAARGSEPMTAVELNRVKQWIALGAKVEEAGGAETTTTSTDAPTESDAPAAEMNTAMHSWTNSAGASLEAAFVGLEGETVTLRREDGTQFEYPIANLQPDSQELARKLATD